MASSISETPAIKWSLDQSILSAAATPAAISRASYLRHLDRCKEILGARLNTIHNLHVYLSLMRQLQAAIAEGRLSSFAASYLRSAGTWRVLWHNAAPSR